jgi:hypothetical protein
MDFWDTRKAPYRKYQCLARSDKSRRQGQLQNAVERHRTSTAPIRYEYRIKHHDGTYRYWKDQALPLLDEQGLPYKWIGICKDITERKRGRKPFGKPRKNCPDPEKWNPSDFLAGGVAHDLNNVLSGIITYPELILLHMDADDKLRKHVEEIRKSGKRAAAIVDDLLTVARGIAVTKVTLNLNRIVQDYLYSPEFKKTEYYHPAVSFKASLDENLLNSSGSPVHIMKAVMNLVSNASEAIEGRAPSRCPP